MIRKLKVPHAIHFEPYSNGYVYIPIKFDINSATDMVINLSMIQLSLVDQIDIVGENGTAVQLMRETEPCSTSGYIIKSGRIALSAVQVEFAISFLLKYIRDGIGDVNHIDIDLRNRTTDCDEGCLIIQIESARPLIGKEARKILGLPV